MSGSTAPSAIPLDAVDLAVAAGLVLVAGAVSVALRLRLERQLGLAAVRTVVQLLAIGYVLRWVFAIERCAVVLVVALLMVVAATRAAIQRSPRRFDGVGARAFVTLVLAGMLTTLAVTALIIGVRPWYRPQYFIPLLGMVLGNCLTGISLCLDTLLEAVHERRERIEMELSLGATRWEAARDHLADAVRRGMIPVINAMMVVGIVSLPGMMTGQILAGADPLDAVKYQIVVMFMIAAGSSLGCILTVLFAYYRVFAPEHRLRAGAIRARKG